MAKKIKTFIVAILFVLILLLSYSVYIQVAIGKTAGLTQYATNGVKLGALTFSTTNVVTVSTGGDSFYECRCEDVSSYLASGYTFIRNDSKKQCPSFNCPVVGAPTITATQDIGQRVGSHCFSGSYNQCGSSCRTSNDICAATLGASWSGGCGSSPSNSQFKTVQCNLNGYTEKGGVILVQNTCKYEPGDLLASQDFTGSIVIDKFSTTYPIKGFCAAQPSILLDENTKASTSTNSIAQTLIDGGKVALTAGQKLRLVYIMQNNKFLPTVCDSTKNLALDVGSPNVTVCQSTLTFATFCDGIYKDGLCITEKTDCDGTLQYETNGNAVCVKRVPVQYDFGNNSCVYDVDRDVGSCLVPQINTCKVAGYSLFEPSQSECSALNGQWQTCPQCPAGRICPTDICHAQCSIGVGCIADSPGAAVCTQSNGTINAKGVCQYVQANKTYSFNICPSGQTPAKQEGGDWECKDDAEVVDGCEATINPLTGQKECLALATKAKQCEANEVLDQSTGKCSPSILVSTQNSLPIIYQEARLGCTNDFGCGDGLVCEDSICRTPIKVGTDWQTVGKFVLIVLVLITILYFIVRKKKR